MIDKRWKCFKFVKYKVGKVWNNYAGLLIIIATIIVVLIGVYILALLLPQSTEILSLDQPFSFMDGFPIIIFILSVSFAFFMWMLSCKW